MKVFFAVVNILIIFLLVWRTQPGDKTLRAYYWSGLLLKLMMGIALGLVYTFYYSGGDTFSFFRDSVQLSQFARESATGYLNFLWSSDSTVPVWGQLSDHEPRTLFVVKLLSVVNLISYDNYWISSLYLSIMSFWGAWILFHVMCESVTHERVSAAISFLFLPSIVFWTSGIVKESVAMGCLFYLAALVVKGFKQKKWILLDWLLLPLACWLLWKLKYYFMAVFFPVGVSIILAQRVSKRYFEGKPRMTLIFFFCSLVILLVFVTEFHPNFEPGYFQEVIVLNYNDYLKLSDSNDVIHYHDLTPDTWSMIRNSPLALISGLFRPFIWEPNNPIQVVAGFENLVILVLFISSLYQLKRIVSSNDGPLAIAAMVYTVLLCVFLSLSTPNLGTLSRYRVGFLPFFVFLITFKNPLTDWVVNIIQKKK